MALTRIAGALSVDPGTGTAWRVTVSQSIATLQLRSSKFVSGS